MKRLWFAAALVLALAGVCGAHAWYLGRITGELGGLLEQAQVLVEKDDWAQAEAVTREALELWEDHGFYLHSTLRHADIDEVYTSFQEVLAFLEGGERQPAEYAAANAKLQVRIDLLLEAEVPSLKNIL